MKRRAFAAASVVAAALPRLALSQSAPDEAETRAVHALFERQWEDLARRDPTWATYRGDLRYNDQLGDESPEGVAHNDAQNTRFLAEARAIRRDRLSASDRTSLELFIANHQRWVDQQAFPGYRSLVLGANGGAQSELADLLQTVPLQTTLQVEQLLRRMAAWPRNVDHYIARMRRGMAEGWVAARPVQERVLRHIDGQLPADVESGPYFQPFRQLPATVPESDQARLRAAARETISSQVVPALRRLRAFVADEYIRNAPPNGSLANYPRGAEVNAMLVRHRTTTGLTPAEIHAIGLRELARIRAEMEGVIRKTGFAGDFAAFARFVQEDPRFFHTGPDALLAGYRDIAKRIDAEMPRLFAELPRAPYGVRGMPAFRGPTAAEYYNGPAEDGSRGGYFFANALAWKTKPRWGMATLTAHEAVPGHHMQIARATELRGLPPFRRNSGYTAFSEGWAVYAETLGREIGLYEDPYDLFGHLQAQAWRAARLVVDTGIHSQGWPRERAIEFMTERTGMNRDFVANEVDRYTSWPGQALGYMIGKLKIQELRQRAQDRLGAKFDVRRFHNAVLDQGALPLDVLDRVIDEWIASAA
jgi:uncharacterized protein (DUF885 family)